MSTLGIIPAAGKGDRWGGYFKEMLPIKPKKWLINNAVTSMSLAKANPIMIVTSLEKIPIHANHFKNEENIIFSLQNNNFQNDIYGAVLEGLKFPAGLNFLAMPDTIFPVDCFRKNFSSFDLWLGCFKTNMPTRFGIVKNDRIYDKYSSFVDGLTYYDAWGVVVWSDKVANFWKKEKEIETFSFALTLAMKKFGYKVFPLDYYYDMASWKDYEDYISSNVGKTI